MSQFFNGIISKVLWIFVAVTLGGVAYLYVINNVLKPPSPDIPPVSSSSPLPPISPASPASSSAPFPSSSPVAGLPNPVAAAPNPIASSAPTDTSKSAPGPSAAPLPAIAQADEVVLEKPKKLEKGGKLRIFPITNDNESPDPLLASPIRQLNIPNLALAEINRGEFQEASGYFLVPSSGSYVFSTKLPRNFPSYSNKAIVGVRIDGTALPDSKGGKLDLEKGWHEIRLFFNGQNYSVEPTEVSVLWSREGDILFPMQVWREVK